MSGAGCVSETSPSPGKDQECDQTLHTALKKLKMDSECAVTKEADSCSSLKHKHDTGTTCCVKTGEEESQEWSRTLQNLCLCDTQPGDGAKPSCSCHKHRWIKDKSAGERNSLNLVHAAGVRKPVLREARLRFPVRDRSKQVLRASRLGMTSKAGVSRGLSSALNYTASVASGSQNHGLSSPGKSASASPVPKLTESDTAKAAFLSVSPGDHATFSSLSLSAKYQRKPLAEKETESTAHFSRYRNSVRSSSLLSQTLAHPATAANALTASSSTLLVSGASPPPASTSLLSSGASLPAAAASPARLDLTMERSCSQEARLDEMSVNELAAYFDEFIHIPKKMSSMAEMMYT